jgi:hypothetical protein
LRGHERPSGEVGIRQAWRFGQEERPRREIGSESVIVVAVNRRCELDGGRTDAAIGERRESSRSAPISSGA